MIFHISLALRVHYFWICFFLDAFLRIRSHGVKIRENSFGSLFPFASNFQANQSKGLIAIIVFYFSGVSLNQLPSSKLTWQWNITIFNREYIFNRSVFHCRVSLPDCNG